ncbi:RRS1 [Candida jiufengensis]|uniref:RRS1 n=1 Tax=Candida jiufengensis TaxID=497108 RepID=UPI0022257C4A|nr:RRS1 [Candida jiufengensis]KAI5955685.1 RRS1 [Candida jiufengensis]
MSSQEYKPVTVDKPIENTYDLGNLATFDPNPLSNEKLTSKNESEKESYIQSITRDNVQLLINQILSLPVKTTTDNQGTSTGQTSSMTLIQLPEPTTPLPREKGIPKDKPKTKWEEFAARKGIKAKTKNGKMEYDEDKGEWVNKWGYKGNNKKLDDQWLVEVNDEPTKKRRRDDQDTELIDPRTLARSERKKLIKKNELQHKRNLKNASS